MDLKTLLARSRLTQSALAERLEMSQSCVSRWQKRGIPPRRVREVSRITGIPPAELRPDLFGDAA
jgi:DNA-binding transcriptional regulator YdaS (Cro superfamily)